MCVQVCVCVRVCMCMCALKNRNWGTRRGGEGRVNIGESDFRDGPPGQGRCIHVAVILYNSLLPSGGVSWYWGQTKIRAGI